MRLQPEGAGKERRFEQLGGRKTLSWKNATQELGSVRIAAESKEAGLSGLRVHTRLVH